MSRATREIQERLDRGGRVTNYERQVLSGEWAAQLVRYRECCLALGTTPPSRAEADRWMSRGPTPGWVGRDCGASVGLGTGHTDLQQLTSVPRGNARHVTT